jgi:hypothetical protein
LEHFVKDQAAVTHIPVLLQVRYKDSEFIIQACTEPREISVDTVLRAKEISNIELI